MAATMYAMRFAVIAPILKLNNLSFYFNECYFLTLVMSVAFIAAGGYVINDYFDRRTDYINHPDSVVVGTKIKRRVAITLHFVLNTIGVLSGIFVSVLSGYWMYGIIFIAISIVLWFYSTVYKRKLLIGNFVISVFTAMVPFIVLLYEFPHLFGTNITNINNIIYIVSGFSFFAFITSMIREVLKDIEDYDGDAKTGCKTLPIVTSVQTAKYVVLSFVLITMVSVAFVYFGYLSKLPFLQAYNPTKWYVLFMECLFIILFVKIIKANSKKDFHLASIFVKIIMLAGVSYSFVLYCSI